MPITDAQLQQAQQLLATLATDQADNDQAIANAATTAAAATTATQTANDAAVAASAAQTLVQTDTANIAAFFDSLVAAG